MEKLAWSIGQVAEAIGMSPSSVRKAVKSRQIPSCKVGKTCRIPVEGLKEYLSGNVEKNGTGEAK